MDRAQDYDNVNCSCKTQFKNAFANKPSEKTNESRVQNKIEDVPRDCPKKITSAAAARLLIVNMWRYLGKKSFV